MRWQDFLDCARRYAHGSTEADLRSAVSRAYYAVFHHFREWLEIHGLKLGKAGQAHSNLYLALFNCGEPTMQQIARNIDDLRVERTDADYDLRKVFDQGTTLLLLNLADKILNSFQSVVRVVPAQNIVDGAKRFLISAGRYVGTP